MMGDFTYTHSKIPDGIEMGRFSQIAWGVRFLRNGEHPSTLNGYVANYPFHEKFGIVDYPVCGGKGDIKIGNDVMIGAGAIILSNVTIGDGAIIGAGAVVTKDVEPYSIVAGNSAKLIRFRFPPEKIAKLLKIQWWNWDREIVTDRIEHFKDIDEFIERYG